VQVAGATSGLVVGIDTFQVNFTLSPNHITSPAFGARPGSHVQAARVIGGYEWPDTTVILPAGGTFARVLPLYCS
jgi:hypothetical protein